MAVKPVPDGYHTATPYLIVQGAAGAIDFYKAAFGAVELMRMAAASGKVGHAAGAREGRPLKDQFYGDRSGTLEDPFGHTWTLATHREDVPEEELTKRAEALMKQQAGA